MHNRFMAVVGLACALAGGILLTPKQVAAQDQGTTYYSYVSQWAVPRADWAAFAKQDQASAGKMKQAVADGLLVGWGTAEVRVHGSGGYTHAEWFTATSRSNLLKVLEDQWSAAANASFVSATKHHDLLLHTFAHGGKAGASGTGYLRVASYQAKPGAADALKGLLMGKLKTFIESEVGKGNLTLYNIEEEDIHTDMPGGFDLVMLFPDGAAIDRFYADFAAMEEADPTVAQAFDSMTLAEDHRDDFMRVTAYENK